MNTEQWWNHSKVKQMQPARIWWGTWVKMNIDAICLSQFISDVPNPLLHPAFIRLKQDYQKIFLKNHLLTLKTIPLQSNGVVWQIFSIFVFVYLYFCTQRSFSSAFYGGCCGLNDLWFVFLYLCIHVFLGWVLVLVQAAVLYFCICIFVFVYSFIS